VRKLLLYATATLAPACASCANKDHLYPVSGKVTYNGSPASGAAVYFQGRGGSSDAPPIVGMVGEDGAFELVCGSLGKGAPPGDYDVLVKWKGTVCNCQGRRRSQVSPDQLNGLYADPQHPLLHATVETGATELPPFELTDAAFSMRP
jgi:hypothetical protein